MLLIFPFSLYFPLLYLQIFSVFLAEYLWGFANNTAPHPRLHPRSNGGNFVTISLSDFTNLMSF